MEENDKNIWFELGKLTSSAEKNDSDHLRIKQLLDNISVELRELSTKVDVRLTHAIDAQEAFIKSLTSTEKEIKGLCAKLNTLGSRQKVMVATISAITSGFIFFGKMLLSHLGLIK